MIRRCLLFLLPLLHVMASPRLPEEFTITERFFSLSSTFDIDCDSQAIGVATKRFFSLSSVYDLEDFESKPVATARTRFFSWGTIADIEDAEGQPLGHIEESLWNILSWGEYKVFDAQNQEIAVATMDFWGTEFSLTDPRFPDRILATMSRSFFHFFRDSWTVKILDFEGFESTSLDPRVFVLLAVYQTDKENRARFYTQYYEQLREELERHGDFKP